MENLKEEEIVAEFIRTIRVNNYENEDFLTYIFFDLLLKQQYDTVILTYLAN